MKIAVMPGDGIGPEVVAQALKVLRYVLPQAETEEAPIGLAGIVARGVPLPPETLALARRSDAILFGSVGGADEASIPRAERPGTGLLQLREELTLFANFRPAFMFPELIGASTLKPEVVDGLDLVILRELTGDVYFGQPRGIETLPSGERVGINTMRYTDPKSSALRTRPSVLLAVAARRYARSTRPMFWKRCSCGAKSSPASAANILMSNSATSLSMLLR